jgi:membrane associated rhomboid family serine protease
METVQLQPNTHEIPAQFTDAAHATRLVHTAATALHWGLISQANNTLHYFAPPSNVHPEEIITIILRPSGLSVSSRPANEYYLYYEQNTYNTTRFKNAFEQAVKDEAIAMRNLHPKNREPYGALLISKTYLATPLLLYANVLVYIAMVLSGISPIEPTAKDLFFWGGNFRPAVLDGQAWRLFSYMFLHGGAMHLIMNSFGLLYVGMFLEPLIGKRRFALAYIITGIAAGLMSMSFHPHSVGVGASGAIFGMYGVFFALLTTSYLQKTQRTTMRRSLLLFIVYGLLAGLEGNTDNAAHLGGLLSGILVGYIFYAFMKKNQPMA